VNCRRISLQPSSPRLLDLPATALGLTYQPVHHWLAATWRNRPICRPVMCVCSMHVIWFDDRQQPVTRWLSHWRQHLVMFYLTYVEHCAAKKYFVVSTWEHTYGISDYCSISQNNAFTWRFLRNRATYNIKDFLLTWNALLYTLPCENIKNASDLASVHNKKA